MPKRKFRNGNGRFSKAQKRTHYQRVFGVAGRIPIIPARNRGYTRISGNYGRYAPAGGEMKFFDTARASHVPATAGTISNLSLNLIPQGVTESTRVGRKCTVKALYIHGNFFLPSTSAPGDTTDRVRFVVYLDKQANGATATVATNGILETAVINSFRDLTNTGRFRILSDKMYTFNCTAGARDGTNDQFAEMIKSYSCYMPKLNIPLEFSSTTGAIAEIRSNNISVLCISQDAKVTVTYTARIRFSDN